ncbi:MAG: hypothetical protein ACOYL6_09070 [Bacteriovoracaceae bacterium]
MYIKLITLISFLILSFQVSATSNIVDLYLDLPNDFLQLTHDSNGKAYTKQERLKAIKVKDIKNGYLHLKDPDSISEYTLAIFRLKNGNQLLALVSSGESVEHFQILQKLKKSWKDVSDTFLPKTPDSFILSQYQRLFPSDKRFKNGDYIQGYAQSVVRYRLPQKGTTIEARTGIDEVGVYDKTLFHLDFDREKFVIRK